MEPTMTRSGPEGSESPMLLGPAEIDRRPWLPVTRCPGVRAKELWRFGDYVDALLSYEPGASTPGVPHMAAHHHIWVVAGEATLAGRWLAAGSYAYVPPGVAHPIRDVGADGCTLLQMHRPFPLRGGPAT